MSEYCLEQDFKQRKHIPHAFSTILKQQPATTPPDFALKAFAEPQKRY